MSKEINNKLQLIIEDGYNTDYIIFTLISLFYNKHESMGKILSEIYTQNPNTMYIQEYVKNEIIYPLREGRSIESAILNKFRIFVYHCGWKYNMEIMDNYSCTDFFIFLIKNIFNHDIYFSTINEHNNCTEFVENLINIKIDKIDKYQKHINNIITVNLSNEINNWMNNNILLNNKSFKFDIIPIFITINIDIDKNVLNLCNGVKINLMEAISFSNNVDTFQNKLLWMIDSIICRKKRKEKHYCLVKKSISMYNPSDEWILFRENKIPSCKIVNLKLDTKLKNKVMRDAILIIYKI